VFPKLHYTALLLQLSYVLHSTLTQNAAAENQVLSYLNRKPWRIAIWTFTACHYAPMPFLKWCTYIIGERDTI